MTVWSPLNCQGIPIIHLICCYLVDKLCPTPWNPVDCSPPCSSVHGIFQARVLEWGAIALTYSFPDLEPVYWSMSSSNFCFLTCTQISQEPFLKVVGYSHLLKNFPESVVIHTVKGFSIVNKAEIDVFLELLLFQ